MALRLSGALFFFCHAAPTEIYPLSLHDALPISCLLARRIETPLGTMLALADEAGLRLLEFVDRRGLERELVRSEEHTSELQSHSDLVCRLLLEKKKQARSPRGPPSRPGPLSGRP